MLSCTFKEFPFVPPNSIFYIQLYYEWIDAT